MAPSLSTFLANHGSRMRQSYKKTPQAGMVDAAAMIILR
ncbi:hypothetical protein AGRO_4992 [Agrobacterium sp. ATCC 31749]|nr:hypothetical protein AGRO_4992 [Agrobacterium sp. ATCC 31749]